VWPAKGWFTGWSGRQGGRESKKDPRPWSVGWMERESIPKLQKSNNKINKRIKQKNKNKQNKNNKNEVINN
jgi:hypothetical protein